ncbi:MAG: hypothetical protein JST46_11950 [Bacteroidetes bacterium]|nr:hypothetical protein [Bacteroidota bacterium]
MDSKIGSWGRAQDAFISGPDPKQLPQMKVMVQKLFDKVKQAYPNPLGCSPKWYGQYKNNPLDYYPNPSAYSLVVPVYTWRCINNKEIFGGETGTWLYIEVNKYGFLYNTMKINGKEYKTLRPVTEVKNGFMYFKLYQTGSSFQEAWLVARKDQLPFTAMTRKEYLALINVTDNTEGDPDAPAVILPYGSFRGFAKAAGDPNAVMVIKDNPNYFDKKLPASVPQFIVVYIKYENNVKATMDFHKAIVDNLKLEELQAMLGK